MYLWNSKKIQFSHYPSTIIETYVGPYIEVYSERATVMS